MYQMIPALLASGATLATSIFNYSQQVEAQKKNEALLRESWARDDKSFSRAYDDIVSRGFSPLAALGNTFGNTNPMTLEAPQLSSANLDSVSQAVGSGLDRKLAAEAQKTADRIADSQVDNIDADTRNKNSEADVNEATEAVQILKAKAELDNLIKSGNLTQAQLVGYLNDMKAEGISDNVIDSLLRSFDLSPLTGSDSLKGTQSILDASALSQAQKKLADSQKTLADSNATLADNQSLKIAGEYKNWSEFRKDLENDILSYQHTIESYRSTVTAERRDNAKVMIKTATGSERWFYLDNALDYLDIGLKDVQKKLSDSSLSSGELRDYLGVLSTILDSLGAVGKALGGL